MCISESSSLEQSRNCNLQAFKAYLKQVISTSIAPHGVFAACHPNKAESFTNSTKSCQTTAMAWSKVAVVGDPKYLPSQCRCKVVIWAWLLSDAILIKGFPDFPQLGSQDLDQQVIHDLTQSFSVPGRQKDSKDYKLQKEGRRGF